MVHGLNENHIAPYTDIEIQLTKKTKTKQKTDILQSSQIIIPFIYLFQWAKWSKAKKQAIAQHLQTTPDDNLGMLALLAFSHAKRNLLKEFAENKTAMKLTNVSSKIMAKRNSFWTTTP